MACALLLSHVVFIVPLLRAHPLPSDYCVVLETRHVMFTARASAILFVASHSTVAWLP
jgi:hypothetical protein